VISPSVLEANDVFAVKISAKAVQVRLGDPGGGSWIYVDQTGFSAIISVVDYW